MNDPEEFRGVHRWLLDELQRRDPARNDDYDRSYDQARKWLSPDRGDHLFHVVSFTSTVDSLRSWMTYAQRGVCVAFHAKALASLGQGELSREGDAPTLHPVIYSTEDDYRQRLTDLLDGGALGIREVAMLPALRKSPDWEDEQETRLIRVVHRRCGEGDAKTSIVHRIGPRGPIPYVELSGVGPQHIDHILVSPPVRDDQFALEGVISMVKEFFGYDFHDHHLQVSKKHVR